MTQYLFLTGVTGQVGQYLLRELLQAGRSLAVLIRPKGDLSAADRLNELVQRWAPDSAAPMPVPLEGDITLTGLGLSNRDRSWIGEHCRDVMHNAASLTFYGGDRDKDPWLSNFTGTSNVLDLCHELHLRDLHYVSTAYVCGTRTGQVYEDDLDCAQDFRNDYEECKFEAEELVRSADIIDNLTVYRPAMIIGDSKTGYTATYHGLYPYLQFADLMMRFLPRDEDGQVHLPIRLNLSGDEGRNLVPIDWVARVMAHVYLHPDHHGKTYHLTPLEPVTARIIERAMSTKFSYYGPTFEGHDVFTRSQMTDLEQQFYEYVSTYQPYWNEEPVFDSTNTRKAAPHLPYPTMDEAYLHRLIDYAVEDRWGKGPAKNKVEREAGASERITPCARQV